jgi:D-alanyl-D-alanine carboxypeptidase/D-alanyl-D-alanine-endopeptidase (penicillin-binding protein 4)
LNKLSHDVSLNARLLLTAWLSFLAIEATAQYAPAIRFESLPADVREEIRLAGLPESAWAIAVVPLPPPVLLGPTVQGLGLNAEAPMNPASVMKLVTTRAALGILGPDHRHHTRIATTGRLESGVLKGDVFFQGGGDPKLVVEDLEQIVQRLQALGIRRIEGHLIIDGSRFAEPEVDPGLFDRKPLSTYNVGPHAAMVNFKSVRITVRPDGARNVKVVTEPRIPEQEVNVRVKVVDGHCGRTRVSARMESETRLLVSGVMGRRCEGSDFYVSVMDHARFAYTAFRGAWETSGGVIRAKLQSGSTPEHARTLVEWESPRPLIQLVSDINKLSNNPMTRQLFLNLSASDTRPATREASARVVRDYLASRGLAFPEMVIDNGSGLSRQERISATSMARLLTDAVLSPDAESWVETLPRVGVEGTVRNRMRNSVIEGRAWLKTGTLDDVRALAGYVRSADGRWVVLVVMVNHPEAVRARPAMDTLVKWVHDRF